MPGTPTSCRFRRILLPWLCLLSLATPAAGVPPATGGMCRAPAAAPPCGVTSSASGRAEPDLDLGLSNPIDLATGEKHLQEIDLPVPLHGGHPSFIRRYRRASSPSGPLGPDWTHEYEIRLVLRGAGWYVLLADGQAVSVGARRDATQAGNDTLRILPQPAHAPPRPDTVTHIWTQDSGHRFDFNTQGLLLAIRVPRQSPTLIERHTEGRLAGHIRHIRRQTGTLTLQYDTTGATIRLTALITPLGRFRYVHETSDASTTDAARRLVGVQRPDGMRRTYHYEPERQGGHPGALTGITLTGADGRAWRARTWSWDTQGRVIRAESGTPGLAALELTYDLPGATPDTRTTRIHSAGREAQVTHHRTRSGRPQVTHVRSTRCAGCTTTDHPVARDANGHLSALGTLRIQRYPGGAIQRLQQTQSGWPALTLDYDATGKRTAWYSTLTGQTRAHFDGRGQLQALRYANGDSLDIGRDTAGRPTLLHHAGSAKAAITIRLDWHGPRLQRLSHPSEDETREYDAQGNLSARTIHRPHADGALRYHERFSYDTAGRLLRHELPEGGALLYDWGSDTRLTALIWQSADGTHHPVITSESGQPGYRYGNGLHLHTWATPAGRAHTLILSNAAQPIWGEQRPSDAQGRVASLQQYGFHAGAAPAVSHAAIRTYAYDSRDRMIGFHESVNPRHAKPGPRQPPTTTWLAWGDDGRLITRTPSMAHPTGEQTQRPITRDPSGLPQSVNHSVLRYQAQRLIAETQPAQGAPIRFTHNAQGHTIRRQQGEQETERYYLDNRLVARWQRPHTIPAPGTGVSSSPPAPTFGVTQRFLYAHQVPVGLLQTDGDGQIRLYYIHADLLGAPVLMTDAQQAIRWSAHYDALGRAHPQGDLDLPLRAPGQDEDPATGWHDNVFRTYLPTRGQYLEPDPVGPLPGEQALGYAAQQPMRHADPLGLVLLAFDGTRYDQRNHSNVWKLTQAYEGGPAYYHAGPGDNTRLDWDAITAASSGQILSTQWQSLLDALQHAQNAAQPVPIDLLGFSRGAALARDFANRIARQTRNGWFSYDDPLRGTVALCVDLRFLGLFDTVAQFGLLGAANAGFDLTIAGAWQWVAHAVALHEFRTFFPLVSATSGAPGNVVEAPFIGAHADIGGGMAPDGRSGSEAAGDLSDVALNWMRWQALAALVPLGSLAASDQQVTQALLHDERLPMHRILENSDRTLQDAHTQSLGLQRNDPHLGSVQRQALEAFIQRVDLWQAAPGNVVGRVNMQGYDVWLQHELGLPSLSGP